MANKNALHQIFQGKSLKHQRKFREFSFSKMWSPETFHLSLIFNQFMAGLIVAGI